MSGLARMLRALGYTVTGCDRAASPELDRLQAEGIQVELGHHPAHVHNAAFLVLSAAVSTSEPEIGAAIQRRLPIVKRAAVLGWLSEHRQCIAVAGAHGKSTTSGMIAWILTQAGYHPSFAVGADLRDLGVNARIDTGEAFVVEADEYDYSFLLLRPSIAVVLNIEHDHPDLFPTPAHVERAFQRFLEAGLQAVQPSSLQMILQCSVCSRGWHRASSRSSHLEQIQRRIGGLNREIRHSFMVPTINIGHCICQFLDGTIGLMQQPRLLRRTLPVSLCRKAFAPLQPFME